MKILLLLFCFSIFSCTTVKNSTTDVEELSLDKGYVLLRYCVEYGWAEFGSLYGIYLENVETKEEIFLPFEKRKNKAPDNSVMGFDKDIYNNYHYQKNLTLFEIEDGEYKIIAIDLKGEKDYDILEIPQFVVEKGKAIYIGDWFFISEDEYSSFFRVENFSQFAKNGLSVLYPNFGIQFLSTFLDSGSEDVDLFIRANSIYN